MVEAVISRNTLAVMRIPVLPGAGVIVENTRMLGFCNYEDADYLFDFNFSNLIDFS